MTPTAYLRFVWRDEVSDYSFENGTSLVCKTRVLQQFWEDPDGKVIFDGAEKSIAGEWRDVPLEGQA